MTISHFVAVVKFWLYMYHFLVLQCSLWRRSNEGWIEMLGHTSLIFNLIIVLEYTNNLYTVDNSILFKYLLVNWQIKTYILFDCWPFLMSMAHISVLWLRADINVVFTLIFRLNFHYSILQCTRFFELLNTFNRVIIMIQNLFG